MHIVHVCLCGPYTDGFAYQENELVTQHLAQGHRVSVLATTETYGNDLKLVHVLPGEGKTHDGAQLIRLPYRRWAPRALMAKLRSHPGVMNWLEQLAPDVVLFHGLTSWELKTVALYKQRYPSKRFYADCHEDFNNSARTWASKWVLHYAYYRRILRRCLPQIDKVLCVTVESIAFARDFYGVDESLLELYPLGGKVFDDDEYTATRESTRALKQWDERTMVFVQSGKLDRAKRLTDSLRAFTALPGAHLRFAIAGHIMSDVEDEVRPLIAADARIQELGWIEPMQLRALLCAADVYVQPGSQSATMQMSLCCRCPVVLDDVPSHRVLFNGNGFLVRDAADLTQALATLAKTPSQQLNCMSARSAAIAAQLLDYRQLARRLLS